MEPFEVEPAKILGPSGLSVVEILMFHKRLEVCMVISDPKLMVCAFEIVAPLSNDLITLSISLSATG
jgi:hypothetical protein